MAMAFSLKPRTSGFTKGFICRRNSRGQRLALPHGILSPQGLHFGHSVSSTDAATQRKRRVLAHVKVCETILAEAGLPDGDPLKATCKVVAPGRSLPE